VAWRTAGGAIPAAAAAHFITTTTTASCIVRTVITTTTTTTICVLNIYKPSFIWCPCVFVKISLDSYVKQRGKVFIFHLLLVLLFISISNLSITFYLFTLSHSHARQPRLIFSSSLNYVSPSSSSISFSHFPSELMLDILELYQKS
jgi:hypothetical protein